MTLCLLLALALGVAACGGSSSNTGSTESGSTTSGQATGAGEAGAGGSTSGGPATAAAEVKKLRGEIDEFTPPGAPIDASSVSGGTVWYIPISASIPVLLGNQLGVEEAAKALGLGFSTCDGKFQPAAMSSCITEAVNAKPVGIVTNGIDPTIVAPAMKAAADAKVPVMALSTSGEESNLVRFIGNGDAESQEAAMNWIIADSEGKANVLALTLKGQVQTEESAAAGVKTLEANCPECTYEAVELTTGQMPTAASATSSALLKNPAADYGFPQFDFNAPEFERGVGQAGRTAQITMVSTNADVGQVKEVAAGGLQKADAGANANYIGWETMDGLLRMVLGKPAATEVTAPVRIFDETNVAELDLSAKAEESGEWWGPTVYKQEFPKLWGIGG
ncbi:MAG: substrate-binding domain-containing protein [Actinobacteria bacterium]|nr:substrate-binding domain-containing protein [Actinomycetota bacterium]